MEEINWQTPAYRWWTELGLFSLQKRREGAIERIYCCLQDFSKFMVNRRPVVELIQQIVILSFLRKHTDLFGCGSCIVSGLSGSAAWQQLLYNDITISF